MSTGNEPRSIVFYAVPSSHGAELAQAFASWAEAANCTVDVRGRPSSGDVHMAVVCADIVIIDLSLDAGAESDNYSGIPEVYLEMKILDHVLVVSRTYLAINVYGYRQGGAPPYPHPCWPGDGATEWTNAHILAWLRQNVQDLIDTPVGLRSKPHLYDRFRTLFEARRIKKQMITTAYERHRAALARTHRVFLSYRSSEYGRILALARAIREGRWHDGRTVDVVVLRPGELSFERELLSEMRRWQIVASLADRIRECNEFWVYETNDYNASWWTASEQMSRAYIAYTWKHDQSWTPPPQLKVFDPQSQTVRDDEGRYAISLTEAQRRRMADLTSMTSSYSTFAAQVQFFRAMKRGLDRSERLGLGGLFARGIRSAMWLEHTLAVHSIPEEDRASAASYAREIRAEQYGNASRLRNFLENPRFGEQFWENLIVPRPEEVLDPETGVVSADRFLTLQQRLENSVPVGLVASAEASERPLVLPDGTSLLVQAYPPRFLWMQLSGSAKGWLQPIPTFVIASS
jgi:hypothetical protein